MSLKKLIRFFESVGRLKIIDRSGWISHVGIRNPESVADHSFRCAVLAMCIGDLMQVDAGKLIKMLLLHDLQEALIGDYDSYVKKEIGIAEVKLREKTAIDHILSLLPLELRNRYISLWEEFEAKKTDEAILANEIDKIEMLLQALEYEKQGYDSNKLEDFWIDVQNRVNSPIILDLFKLLRDERQSLIN